ncbi:MAG: tRNA (uridine(34)/cytosine(34)/5-carboxymethylaminomethyluridine(34)-2'-O)-methyltransferase TrmL, partial [Oscillospiraceae bacterium]|nr:tRNA (uridine(34)/cytosine(34)/5-carboxymethylaminomethyluridine(34)-2'-O)-methyltransferase TrmL [Oscillospiraceae bacterium]
DDRKLKRAGLDYWDKLDITYYDSLDDMLGRADGELFFFTTKGRKRHTDAVYPDNCWLVFGREDAGLPESLLYNNPSGCVRIPMRQTLRSLNLSNSVAIAAYEVLRQWDYPGLCDTGELTEYTWER